LAHLCPIVKAVSRNKAAPPAHGVAEGGLVEHGFAARVDDQREGLRILDPVGYQSPAHECEGAVAVRKPHDRNRLGRRYVVAGREIRPLGIPEKLPD